MDALNTYAFDASQGVIALASTPNALLKSHGTSIKWFHRRYTPEQWHKDIDQTANGLLPVHTSIALAFPWKDLRSHTDVYLAKRHASVTNTDEITIQTRRWI